MGIMKPQSNGKAGYWQVRIRFNGKHTSKTVHYLVALAFLGPRPEGLDIAHYDGDKSNNRPDNLRYTTRADNMADGVRLGMTYGKQASKPIREEFTVSQRKGKLTVGQRNRIVDRLLRGERQVALAGEYGVSPAAISNLYLNAVVR